MWRNWLGTSVATASRVLAGAGLAADETRQRIEDAAQTLNYQPNLQARALRRQSSRAIGLVMPNLLNAGYTALADAAGRILAERGYHLLLSPTGDDPHTEAETLRDMVGQNVDGLDPGAIGRGQSVGRLPGRTRRACRRRHPPRAGRRAGHGDLRGFRRGGRGDPSPAQPGPPAHRLHRRRCPPQQQPGALAGLPGCIARAQPARSRGADPARRAAQHLGRRRHGEPDAAR